MSQSKKATPTEKNPALDAVIAKLAELNREATERIDRLLERLQRQLADSEGKPR